MRRRYSVQTLATDLKPHEAIENLKQEIAQLADPDAWDERRAAQATTVKKK